MNPNGRENDLRMLHEALDLESLSDEARSAFDDMLTSLESRRELSDKQRQWLRSVLDEPEYAVPCGRDLGSVKHTHVGECTAACPGWTPPTLRSLPKLPPGRRA